MTHEEKTLFFEENYEVFNKELEKKRHKWHLKATPHIDYEDIKQQIFKHIFVKLEQFDPTKGKLEHWVSKIVNNQIFNSLRNHYGNCVRPCVQSGGCWFNTGGDSCLYTSTKLQNSECPLYAAWELNKKRAFDVKIPLPMCNHETQVFEIPGNELDFDTAEKKLHEEMEKVLKPHEFRVYKLMIIMHLSDAEIAKELHLKTSEKHRSAGYNTLNKMRKLFLIKARQIRDDHDLF